MFSDRARSILKLQWKIQRRLKIVWEKLYGFDFSRNHSLKELGFKREEANIYSPTSNLDLKNVLKKLDIQSSDSVLDFGSGKGSVIVAMSKYKFKHVDGVELSRQLCEIAERNLKKLGIMNSKIFHSDAKEFDNLDVYTYFYFFNPFPGNILKSVIQNIKNSFNRRPRKITIMYYLPAFRNVIEEDGFFQESGTFETKYYEMKIYVNEFNG